MADILQWSQQIELALSRHARSGSREDLRQELFLAVLERSQEIEVVLQRSREDAEEFVIEVCRDRLLGTKKKEPAPESLSDPVVAREIKKKNLSLSEAYTFRSLGAKAKKLVQEAVAVLPEIEQVVIRGLFYEDQNEKDLAEYLGRSVKWVCDTREVALNKIQNILTEGK